MMLGSQATQALNPADVFEIDLAQAPALDSVDLTGWDLVIGKSRQNSSDWVWRDRERGMSTYLRSNSTAAEAAFNNYAARLGSPGDGALWKFKKAAGFFDVVTFTGTGGYQQVTHDLGVVPAFIAIKRTDAAEDWENYHRSTGGPFEYYPFALNTTAAASFSFGGSLSGDDQTDSRIAGAFPSGAQYVAYLFAHDPSDTGIIQCGSYTGNGSTTGPAVTLGWRPQWLLIKRADATGDWWLYDSARSPSDPRNDVLFANLGTSEVSDASTTNLDFVSTGFQPKGVSGGFNANGGTYLYVAIREAA